MKIKISSIFSLCFIIVFSAFIEAKCKAKTAPFQPNGEADSTVIGAYNKNTIIIYNKNKRNQYYIARKVAEGWMSTPFHKEDFGQLDTIIIEPMKIIGNDSGLVIISWNHTKKFNHENDEIWYMNYSIKKIWDIKEMKELFSVKTQLNFERSKTLIRDEAADEIVEETLNCSYKFDFSIDNSGTVRLTLKASNFSHNCDDYLPEKTEGVYFLKDMKYIRKK